MKYCPSCKINVEGAFEQCPLCQNGLHGEPQENVYPSMSVLRKQSYLYKIQLFVLIAGMLSSVAVDLFMEVGGSMHWSLIVVAWVLGGELWLAGIIRKHHNLSYIVTYTAIWGLPLVMVTFIIIGYTMIFFAWILPIAYMVIQILHFVYMMLDKAHNAMIYLLVNSIIGLIAFVIYVSVTGERSLLWMIAALTAVLGIIGAVIFKGRRVTNELQKRFHI